MFARNKRTLTQRLIRVTLYRPVALGVAQGAATTITNANATRRAHRAPVEPLTLDKIMRVGGVESAAQYRRAYAGKQTTACVLVSATTWCLWMLGGAPTLPSAVVDAGAILVFGGFYSILGHQLWVARSAWRDGVLRDPTIGAYCEAVVNRPLEALPLALRRHP